MKTTRRKRVLAMALVLAMILAWVPLGAQAAAENLALEKPATASNVEAGTQFTADKAVDGDQNTRWGTDQNVSNPSIEISLGEAKDIQQIDIYFERDDAGQNILAYQVEFYANGAYETVYSKNERAAQHERITLEAPESAEKVKITVTSYDGGTMNWASVSIREIELYATPTFTINDIVEQVEATANTEIPLAVTDAAQLVPSIEGYTVAINGADYEQIIAKNGTIHHPLTDKTVQVSFTITDETTNETVTTGDIPYLVKGQYTQDAANNTKPVVIPEIQEWYSDSTEKLSITSLTKITYDSAELKTVVDEFVSDIQALTGYTLTATQGAAADNAINFSLSAPDDLLGEEGYTIEILTNRIDVQSVSTTGNMYGMQTILQVCKQLMDQGATEFGVGQMRDYPRFEVRGLLLDMARKPIALNMITDISRNMRYYKMNDLQLHLSDNLIFLEDYGVGDTENLAFNAYEAFRLESSLTNEAGESPTAEDYAISKVNMANFIQTQRALGMNIVPEIDVPAHSLSFTSVWPELSVVGGRFNNTRPLIDHFDLTKPEAVAKIKEIFDDYTKGDFITFDEDTIIHVGADEFTYDYTAYRQYYNTIIPYIKETNPTIRIWGSLTWINDNQTEIIDEAIEGVQMHIWSRDWANFQDMYDMGYDLINIIDTFGYMVPNGSLGRGAYNDLVNVNYVFNEFKPNQIDSTVLPSSDDQILGAAFAIWNDNIDTRASGLSESDMFYRFFDALPFYAEKTWATTGQEKGTADALAALSQEIGIAPNTNPYYQVESTGDVHESYDFSNMEDASANGRDLIAGTAEIADGALVLSGGNSYVSTPIDKIGNGNELSFDITLTEIPEPGDILFECTPEYSTHDIRIMEDGRLGFTRELYSYYFDYTLPVGKTVNIKIVAEQQDTTLYVDGALIGEATGKFIHNNMEKKTGIQHSTFAIPLERIGSETNAINATIDNVVVKVAEIDADPYNKAGWTKIDVDTETADPSGANTEGEFEYAWDGNSNTIWHSDWKTAQDKLDGTNTFSGEIDFGQEYLINQFSFTPRQPQDSGRITQASLYIGTMGENEEITWTAVAEHVTFADDATKKTIFFEEQSVRYVKFVAEQSDDGWVAVSEFDIANIPAPTCTVYVAAEGEGTATASETEVASGTEVTVTATPDEGYVFDGWYDAVGTKVSEDAEYTLTVTGNTALIAKFIPVYTVTLDYGYDIEPVTVTVEEGQTVAELPTPEREGYTFVGWFDAEGNAFTTETIVTADITVTAKWTEIVTEPDPDVTNPTQPSEPDENDPTQPSEPEPSKPQVPECDKDGDCVLSEFSDIKIDDWYHDGVHFCIDQGLMNGMGDGTFAPNEATTRAQLVIMLYRLEGEPSIEGMSEPFTDVAETDWFYAPIVWAYNTKVVNGMTETTFEPNTNVSREQVATILYRYLGSPEGSGKLDAYPDVDKVQDYAKDALVWAVGEGLINGVKQADGTSLLDPAGNATRAQIATILMRHLTA